MYLAGVVTVGTKQRGVLPQQMHLMAINFTRSYRNI